MYALLIEYASKMPSIASNKSSKNEKHENPEFTNEP
jgi:hypothetical protein